MRRTLLPLLAYSSIIVVIIFPSSFSSCYHWRCHALVLVKNPSVVVPFPLLGGRSSSSNAQQRSTFHRQHMTSSEFSTPATAIIAPAATTSSSAATMRATKRVGINSRGAKMNEIDFTLAPMDVSLSRCYQMSERNNNINSNNNINGRSEDTTATTTSQQSLSLTRALNTASNRAVRRILLSRSWPSAEALNASLRAIAIQQQQQQQQKKEEAEKDGLLPYAANASRIVAAQQQQQQQQQLAQEEEASISISSNIDKMKCPVPRPILNILMSRRGGSSGAIATAGGDDVSTSTTTATTSTMTQISTSEEREQQWVKNQIADFYNTYGGKSSFSDDSSSGYNEAEAYLESILSLATTGIESERVVELYNGSQRTYTDAYKRILSVIQSVGAVLEKVDEEGTTPPSLSRTRRRIAKKLIDQDFCLSMLDKIALANERKKLLSISSDDDASSRRSSISSSSSSNNVNPLAIPYDSAARLEYETNYMSNKNIQESTNKMSFEDFKVMYEAQTVAMVMAKKKFRDESIENLSRRNNVLKANLIVSDVLKMKTNEVSIIDYTTAAKKQGKRWFKFWSKGKQSSAGQAMNINTNVELNDNANDEPSPQSGPEIISIKSDDLGGVLLSAEEPTMTRQLNVLTNICHRTMIFGGDQEVLLLAETLDADKPAFIQRWYTTTDHDTISTIMDTETRPGVQYLNSLIQLLRDCYTQGAVNDVTPTHPMTTGYQNAYGRLTASLIELGSGYIRPPISSLSPLSAATEKYLSSTARPKSAKEELGRLANWEKAIRKNSENPYPNE